MSKQETPQHQLSDFSGNEAFTPRVAYHLMGDRVKPLIDISAEVAANDDVAILTVAPGMQFAVARNPEFMKIILNDTLHFGKPDAAEVMEVFGGKGVLSMSPYPDGQPYQREAGRDAVKEYFNKEMSKPEFAEQIKLRHEALLHAMKEHPDIAYDTLVKDIRLDYLRNLYFGTDISQQEMKQVYTYA